MSMKKATDFLRRTLIDNGFLRFFIVLLIGSIILAALGIMPK